MQRQSARPQNESDFGEGHTSVSGEARGIAGYTAYVSHGRGEVCNIAVLLAWAITDHSRVLGSGDQVTASIIVDHLSTKWRENTRWRGQANVRVPERLSGPATNQKHDDGGGADPFPKCGKTQIRICMQSIHVGQPSNVSLLRWTPLGYRVCGRHRQPPFIHKLFFETRVCKLPSLMDHRREVYCSSWRSNNVSTGIAQHQLIQNHVTLVLPALRYRSRHKLWQLSPLWWLQR
jgi:hypothetical protein